MSEGNVKMNSNSKNDTKDKETMKMTNGDGAKEDESKQL